MMNRKGIMKIMNPNAPTAASSEPINPTNQINNTVATIFVIKMKRFIKSAPFSLPLFALDTCELYFINQRLIRIRWDGKIPIHNNYAVVNHIVRVFITC